MECPDAEADTGPRLTGQASDGETAEMKRHVERAGLVLDEPTSTKEHTVVARRRASEADGVEWAAVSHRSHSERGTASRVDRDHGGLAAQFPNQLTGLLGDEFIAEVGRADPTADQDSGSFRDGSHHCVDGAIEIITRRV